MKSLLFSSLCLKENILLKNRIVMPPMATYLADQEGCITDGVINHYLLRAEKDVGLIIVESTYITDRGKYKEKQLGISNDKHVPELRKAVAEIKKRGCKIALQLNHCGSMGKTTILGMPPEAPSTILHPSSHGDMPEELSQTRIAELINEFQAAACRVVEAGFDAVEVHGANGYLLNQFFSPLTNKRADSYGGSREKRLRFALEVVQKVRRVIPPSMPLLFRLNTGDRISGGLSIEDVCFAAPRLVEAGADLIDVAGGLMGSRPDDIGNIQGYFVPFSREIKKVVNVPVIVTGGIWEPAYAEQVLQQGNADLIGVGRALLKDPEWAIKARKFYQA